MFSTKPAQRPIGSRRWFKRPTPTPKASLPVIEPAPIVIPPFDIPGQPIQPPQMVVIPRVVGHRPAVPTPQHESPPRAGSKKVVPTKCNPVSPKPQCPAPTAQSINTKKAATPQHSPRNPRYPLRVGPAREDNEKFDGWMAKFCVEPQDDCDGCCLSFWVPCAQYGKTHWRLNQVEEGRNPSNAAWSSGKGCNGPCWAWFGFSCFCYDCILTGFQRTRVRATYGINGSLCNDFCTAIWCRPCTMVQMDREVQAREGDMDLRTNPKAPFVDYQPSRMPAMSYVSPRPIVSDNSLNGSQNARRDCSGGVCDGADPLAGDGVLKKSHNQQSTKSGKLKFEDSKLDKTTPESPRSEKLRVENSNKSSQSVPARIKTSEVVANLSKSSIAKSAGTDLQSSTRDVPLPKYHEEAEKRPLVNKSDSAVNHLQNGNHKLARSSSASISSQNSAQSHAKHVENLDNRAESINSQKGKGLQPQQHSLAKKATEHPSPKFIATKSGDSDDVESIVVGSSKPKVSQKDMTTDTNDSYIHDFTDYPVDSRMLDYYEKEEQKSQASRLHTVEDSPGTEKDNKQKPQRAGVQMHYLADDPPEKVIVKEKPQRAGLQTHYLADDPPEKVIVKEKPQRAGLQTHYLADDPLEKVVVKEKPQRAGLQTHYLADDLPTKDLSGQNKPASLQAHNLADDSQERDGSKTKAEPLHTHTLTHDPEAWKGNQTLLHPHTLADCPEKDTNKAKFAHAQPHDLVDCESTKHSHITKRTGPQSHTLADCDPKTQKNVDHSALEQHDLADCRGDGSRPDRRTSSAPVSNAKPEATASGDSQSTVKPSSQHTLSDCMGGSKLERQNEALNHHPPAERHASLSSLRDFFKGKHDTADHPQKSRYRNELDDADSASGAKRTSHAQQSLSHILGTSGVKKEKSGDDPVDALKGAIHSVGDRLKKRSDSIGDTLKRHADKAGANVKRSTESLGQQVKGGTVNAGHEINIGTQSMGNHIKTSTEHAGHVVKEQTDKIGSKDEHKGSGFANMLGKMSPKSRAH